jgi:peptidoglycan/xylan/chitin deacetylase (PgdA/CDA1 family)
MNLCAALTAPSLTWELMLTQEGLPWQVVDLREGVPRDQCSVLVVVRPLEPVEGDAVLAYLRSGGGVIGAAHHLAGVLGTTTRRERLSYILGDGDDAFNFPGVLDLGLVGWIPREANRLRTQQNDFALFAGPASGGAVVLFPFDVHAAMADSRTATRAFYRRRERLPSEQVSLVAKGEVRHLVHQALAYVHHARGLPYVHLWYYPSGAPNILAFRVDTDGAPQSDIDTLYDVVRESGVGATWFVDVRAHESWLPHFAALTGQEIGLHCYEHRVAEDPEWNRRQIARGRDLLDAVGLAPRGFAAPYGTWRPDLASVIDEFGFDYSSEFSCAYDTLPMIPEIQDRVFRTLQVPVHPVSIGSLLRIGATGPQMDEYFRSVTAVKLARHEPLFFYHHPTHRQWNVVLHLLEGVRTLGIKPMTLGAYAMWWKDRTSIPLQISLTEGVLSCSHVENLLRHDLAFHATRSDGTGATFNPAKQVVLSTLPWRQRVPSPLPSDIRRVREIDPRRLLGDLYNAMLRRLK